MRNILSQITFDHLTIAFLVLLLFFIILVFSFKNIQHKNKILSQELFSSKREFDQRLSLLQNSLTLLAKDLPLAKHPSVQEKELTLKLEVAMNQFSHRLSQTVNNIINTEQNQWNEKFAILLESLGKNEHDLLQLRDKQLKEAWDSISEISKKSQLLFHDMKEDGIFYRMQSLWLLSNLSFQQHQYTESFRHLIAGLKLYHESKPRLPISQKMVWKLGENLNNCSHHLDLTEQRNILSKFHLSSDEIFTIFEDMNRLEMNPEIFRKIQYWKNSI